MDHRDHRDEDRQDLGGNLDQDENPDQDVSQDPDGSPVRQHHQGVPLAHRGGNLPAEAESACRSATSVAAEAESAFHSATSVARAVPAVEAQRERPHAGPPVVRAARASPGVAEYHRSAHQAHQRR